VSSVAAPDSSKTNQGAANNKQSVFAAAINMLGLRRSRYVRYKTVADSDCCRAFCTVADDGIGVINSLQGSGGRIVEDLAESIRAHTVIESGRDGTKVTVVVPAS
jgi:two-component sensor histidine kinase